MVISARRAMYGSYDGTAEGRAGVNSRTSRQRRLLTLLAGFFGLAVTATLSIVPGSGVAEVIRAGTAAAANGAGSREAAARAAVNRDRRATAVWNRWTAADAAYLWHRYGPSPDAKPLSHTGAHAQHAVLPAGTSSPGRGTRPAFAAAPCAVPPKSAHLSAVQVRGPPTITGS
ncbi:hypothetical protein AGRA3207_005813 [Actinomadura graeca]|uniref:CAP domain-containing protein n=1 Tax=Actinomadura graeca TaxID=2750812 RepID=A0ABX8R096_9ACTN|nr:hypothetical protein [Actinomadura graeca]QXJ24480.1 hypothetical protein AGRA3207_005813 [Actinomadura graeca]